MASTQPCVEQALKQRAAFRLQQRVLRVGLRRIDIAIGRHDVEVAGQHDRHAGRIELRGMRDETLHPRELVGEFRAGLRVAVRRIERRDEHAVHRRLDVAALGVGGIAGQLGARDDRLAVAREDGDAVPGFLRRARPRHSRPSRSPPAETRHSAAFSSCRQTTSGLAMRSQSSRLARRLLTLLMLKVAIFIRGSRGGLTGGETRFALIFSSPTHAI